MNIIIGIIVAVAAIFGIIFFIGHKNIITPMQEQLQESQQMQSNEMDLPENSASQETVNSSATVQAEVSVQKQTVAVKNFAFSPATVTIKVGSTVTWSQQDSAPHSIVADDGSFASATLASGQLFSFTFTKPGIYTYHCGIHPMMKGTIIVQ